PGLALIQDLQQSARIAEEAFGQLFLKESWTNPFEPAAVRSRIEVVHLSSAHTKVYFGSKDSVAVTVSIEVWFVLIDESRIQKIRILSSDRQRKLILCCVQEYK